MNQRITWQGQARILAFVILSAWSLYVGGIIAERMDFLRSLAAIFAGYFIFVILYTFYAGTDKGKDELLKEAFGMSGARYFVSLLAVSGQIGWYAIVIEIGGTAFAHILGVERGAIFFLPVIVAYSMFMVWVACGGQSRIGKVSYFGIPAMVLFSLWGAYAVFMRLGMHGIMIYEPAPHMRVNFGMGVELVLASFISFSVIIPDFLHKLRRKEIFLASFWGLIPPAIFMGGLGVAFAIVGNDFNVLTTMRALNSAWFMYAFLSVDNLSSASALYPIGIGFANFSEASSPAIFERRRKFLTFFAGIMGIALAMVGVMGRLEGWLNILGTVFSPIIGVVLANQYFVKKDFSDRKIYLPALAAWILGCTTSFVRVGIPVLQSLAVSLIAFVAINTMVKKK